MTERERLIELLNKKYDHFCDQCGVNKDSRYTEDLADYLIANGVIVPPCKVGDTVYVISQMKDKRILPFVNEYEATYIQVGKRKCKVYHEKDGFIKIFLQDNFGKTVFLTREEAEKALKKEVNRMHTTIKSHKGTNNGNYKHGGKGTKLYEVWYSMRRRCNKANSNAYKYYGGRGIKVCKEWDENYSNFEKWARDNGYREGLTIDRIDVNGNYEPSNCRWVSMKMQANNQRNTLRIEYKGDKKTLHEWASILGIKAPTLYYRIYKSGWTIERAFSEEVSLDRYHRKSTKGA